MSVKTNVFDRESICSTCLSQDRKLFTVSDSQNCDTFCSEFSLALTDKICWECHQTVLRLVSFKRKVQKAQAWLRLMSNGQKHAIRKYTCLSSLSISTGINLNVTDPYPCTNTIMDENHSVHSDVVESESPKAFLISKKGALPVEVLDKNDEGNVDENFGEFDKVWIKDEPNTEEEESHSETDDLKEKKEPKKPEPTYIQKIMTEEEMVAWREKKKNLKFYTNSIPSERCDKCLEPLDSERYAVSHAKKHTEIYGDIECNICQQRSVNEQALAVHKRWHYRLLKCRKCDYVWDNINSMRKHCEELHKIPQTMWDCEQCFQQVKSLNILKIHEKTHLRQNCAECREAVTKAGLKKHKLVCVMSNENLPIGDPLEHSLTSIRNRTSNPTHTDQNMFIQMDENEKSPVLDTIPPSPAIYVECGDSNTSPPSTSSVCHMDIQVSSDVDSSPSPSSKRVRRSSQIGPKSSNKRKREHKSLCVEQQPTVSTMAISLNEADLASSAMQHEPLIACAECGKQYRGQAGLKRHARRHKTEKRRKMFPLENPVRSKLCDYCGHAFTTKSMLRDHINSHTGLRPYVCHLCGADFTQSSSRYLHLQYKHKIPKKTDRNTKKKE